LAGCKAGTNERTFLSCRLDRHVSVRDAPYDGEYRLYRVAEHVKPTTQFATPLRSERLKRGEKIGFARDESGQLVAVVRVERVPLDAHSAEDGVYTWTVQPDPGQIDRGKTLLLVVVVVAVIATGVAIGVAASNAPSGFAFAPAGGTP
jgi:hypothetical protein